MLYTSCTDDRLFHYRWLHWGKVSSLNTYILASHVDRARVGSSWQTMFQRTTVAYKSDFVCLKMNSIDGCPCASLVLSLPVHPGFFWPGLLLPHVIFAGPGLNVAFLSQHRVFWSGGFVVAFSAGGSMRSGTIIGADTTEVRTGARQNCSVIPVIWPRKSALSSREEEDRDVAAAVRASVAAKRQEEKKRVEDKEDSSSRGKKEDLRDSEVLCSKRVPKSSNDAIGEWWACSAAAGACEGSGGQLGHSGIATRCSQKSCAGS